MVSNKLKSGGKVKKLKPIPPGNKGLPKLPKEVRNKRVILLKVEELKKRKVAR